MLWIHGGGFTQGSGSGGGATHTGGWTDGTHLVQSQDVVFVTINYRLGPLGFLVTDKASGSGGMNAIRDQVLALRWVRDHIARFGGDPTRVTVFGESAGGCATCTLALSPLAHGLMRRAIVESGPCIGKWGPESAAYGWMQTEALLARHGARGIAELAKVNASELSWPLPTGGYFYDAGVLPNRTELLFSEGAVHVDTLVIGGNSFDGTAEALPWAPKYNGSSHAMMEAVYAAAMTAQYGVSAARVMSQYPIARFNGSAIAAFVQADSDKVVTCPSLEISTSLSSAKSRHRTRTSLSSAKSRRRTRATVFAYHFRHFHQRCDFAATPLNLVPRGYYKSLTWASHASEIMFVFGSTVGTGIIGDLVHCPFDDSSTTGHIGEQALSDAMGAAWASVARTGHPGESLPWVEFSAKRETLVMTAPEPSKVEEAAGKSADCAFWKHLGHSG